MSLHSVGWFIVTAMCLVTCIAAGYQGFYIASGCYLVMATIAGYFCFETAQEDEDE